jgi:hypothetical protein
VVISFLLVCKEIGIPGLNEIEHIIELLKKRDYMELNEEQKKSCCVNDQCINVWTGR